MNESYYQERHVDSDLDFYTEELFSSMDDIIQAYKKAGYQVTFTKIETEKEKEQC